MEMQTPLFLIRTPGPALDGAIQAGLVSEDREHIRLTGNVRAIGPRNVPQPAKIATQQLNVSRQGPSRAAAPGAVTITQPGSILRGHGGGEPRQQAIRTQVPGPRPLCPFAPLKPAARHRARRVLRRARSRAFERPPATDGHQAGHQTGTVDYSQPTTLSGGVKIVQGTLNIDADRAVISFKDGEASQAVLTGNQAVLRQQMDNGTPMTARGRPHRLRHARRRRGAHRQLHREIPSAEAPAASASPTTSSPARWTAAARTAAGSSDAHPAQVPTDAELMLVAQGLRKRYKSREVVRDFGLTRMPAKWSACSALTAPARPPAST